MKQIRRRVQIVKMTLGDKILKKKIGWSDGIPHNRKIGQHTDFLGGQASNANTHTAISATHVKHMLENTYVFHMYNI